MTSLIRFSPAAELRRLQAELDRVFEGYWPARANGDEPAPVWSPRVDIKETPDAFLVRIDVPGIPKDSIDINFNDGTLSVSGERKAEEKTEHENFVRVERSYGRFFRSFELPNTVDADNITASYEDGVLTVRVPKAEESKPRRIQVS
ncbi:MAG TPA: Hsp20/alpha crystallin family protein [Rhodothermales bacterium]